MKHGVPDLNIPNEETPYTSHVDMDEFLGNCTSTNNEETVECSNNACKIAAGSYCIGGTKEAQMHSYSQADEYPAKAVELEVFYIDQNPITRSQYVNFVNTQDPTLHSDYVSFKLESEIAIYGLTYGNNQFIININANNVLDFATQKGATAYCEANSKRLCTAEEWEAACRGFDDDPFPKGTKQGDGESDYGVRNMGYSHYEYVSDEYTHDSLQTNNNKINNGTTPMLKGGNVSVEQTCWSRSAEYIIDHPTKRSFRCCW